MDFPNFVTRPEPSLFDESLHMHIEGLKPSEVVTIYVTTAVKKHFIYESFANYRASKKGVVDLSKDSSLHGSYVGVEPMGLFWSMTSYAESQHLTARFLKADVTKPQVYRVLVFADEKQSLEDCRTTKESKSIASALVNRWFMAPGVRRIPVKQDGISATLFLPPGEGPFPGLISFHGFIPGVIEHRSALHASHGFASLALAYIGKNLALSSFFSSVSMDYFQKALYFMMANENVLSENGIGISANCSGCAIALAMATYMKGVSCVVAINGSCITYDPSRHVIDVTKLKPNQVNDFSSCLNLRKSGEYEKDPNFIPFHKQQHVSFMLICGMDDACMPSAVSIEMENILQKANHPDFQVLKYENTGHHIEPSYFPYCFSFLQAGISNKSNSSLSNGGTLISNSKAQLDSWPKILQFFKEKLVDDSYSVKSQL